MSQDLLVHVFVVAGWTERSRAVLCKPGPQLPAALMQIINHIFIFSIKVCAAESYLQSAQSRGVSADKERQRRISLR